MQVGLGHKLFTSKLPGGESPLFEGGACWVKGICSLCCCRVSGRQACVVWGWMLEVEGILSGANWQGLVQGALQALRGSRHMAMWVPRQDMLEDMCHGFV